MKVHMATRNTTDNIKVDKTYCTEFVLHKKFQSIYDNIKRKIIDFTEHKLVNYMSKVKNPQQLKLLQTLIVDYAAGQVVVAWKGGQPVYIKVSKST